jgi:hypothetical protein
LPEDAPVPADLLVVAAEREVERQEPQHDEPTGDEVVTEPAEERDEPARLVGHEQLRALRIEQAPVAAEQRAGEVLLEGPDDLPGVVEDVVAAAELEDGPRRDREQVRAVAVPEPEADVLLDLHALLLDEEQRLALLVRTRGGDADPVLVGHGAEGLLHDEPVGRGDRRQHGVGGGGGGHGGAPSDRWVRSGGAATWCRSARSDASRTDDDVPST